MEKNREKGNQKEINAIQKLLKRIDDKWKKSLQIEKEKHRQIVKELELSIAKAKDEINLLEKKIATGNKIIFDLTLKLKTLQAKLKKAISPPLSFGSVIKVLEDNKVAIISEGRSFVVNIVNEKLGRLNPGQEVLLNSQFNIVDASNILSRGEVSRITQILDEYRVIIEGPMNEKKIVYVSDKVREIGIKVGDVARWDASTNFIVEKITLQDELQLELEKVPDVTFDQIGGLGPKIEKIKQEFIWPIIYREEFRLHKCLPIKGGILFGPPGCGKTLIGKALANYMAKLLAKKLGRKDVKGYFSYIRGPELSSKWVGETERMIRELFKKAQKRGADGAPVVLFFDEIESFLRTRGSGISSDAKDDYVTQFNALIDGMEEMQYVLIIGATNRPDMIDPAVIREGRLELKLEINRPDKNGTKEIFSIYLTPDLPLHPKYKKDCPKRVIEQMIDKATEYIFKKDKNTEFMEISYQDGTREILYFSDFISGAMIRSIVARIKTKSIIRKIQQGQERGILMEDVIRSIRELYQENKHLIDIQALKQEFIFRPGKKPIGVKSLIQDKITERERGKLEKPQPEPGIL